MAQSNNRVVVRAATVADVDAIVAPVAPTPAFKLGAKTDDPVQMYLEDIYSVAASLAGICGMSVPCGETAAGLPIGVQIVGRPFAEEFVLAAAAIVEEALGGWHRPIGLTQLHG